MISFSPSLNIIVYLEEYIKLSDNKVEKDYLKDWQQQLYDRVVIKAFGLWPTLNLKKN